MTTTTEALGHDQVLVALDRTCLSGVSTQRFIENLGLEGMSWLVTAYLDRHYPIEAFPVDIVIPSWLGNDSGREFGPGVRWIALLRQAQEELNRAK